MVENPPAAPHVSEGAARMADKIPFGIDGAVTSKIDWDLALKRISHDLRSDFIYAPHLGFIYAKAGDQLIKEVRGALSNGAYSPGLPITIEVPKSFRIQ